MRCFVRTKPKPGTLTTLLLTAVFVVAARSAASAGQPSPMPAAGQSITIEAHEFSLAYGQRQRTRFGKLDWLGGIVLSSSSPRFGGFSGLDIDKDGKRLIAVSDKGAWLTAEIDYDGHRPIGLKNARLGPLRDPKGAPLAGKKNSDAEGLAVLNWNEGGELLVSFERRHRIVKYALTANGVSKQLGSIPLPRSMRQLRKNRGLEGLTIIGEGRLKGTIVAFAERPLQKSGGLTGWLIGGPTPGIISLDRLNEFDVTDLAALPDGDLLVLERRYRMSADIRMRIRRIPQNALRPGASRISGEILFEGTGALNIDNMEGIAVHRTASGRTVLTVISDDNFNFFQRTLLMQFELPDTPRKKPS